MFTTIKAYIKLIIFFCLTLVFLIPVLLFSWHKSLHQKSVQTYFKVCLLLLAVKVKIDPKLQKSSLPKKVLYIANHTSYLDIFVLGANLPVKFTPKSDIASWPVVGWIVKLSGAVFIDRRPSQVKKQQVMLERSFAQGNQLMLFAEGTTNNGAELLPFKSSLFSVAHIVDGLKLVPVMHKYLKLNNKACERTELDQLAWYADMTLGTHFFNLLKQRSVEVELKIFDVIDPDEYEDRKNLSAACEKVLRDAF